MASEKNKPNKNQISGKTIAIIFVALSIIGFLALLGLWFSFAVDFTPASLGYFMLLLFGFIGLVLTTFFVVMFSAHKLNNLDE